MSIRSNFLSCKEIDYTVIRKIDNFSFDSVWESLAPPEEGLERGAKFKELFITSCYHYSRFFPVMHFMDFSSSPLFGSYEFTSNFEDYLSGNITKETDLRLIPIMLLQANGRYNALRFIYYDEPVLICKTQIFSMLCKCRHPTIVRLDESGNYTAESGLYGAYDREKFLAYFKRTYLEFIKSERDHAKLQLPIELYGNIDEALENTKEYIGKIQRTNAVPLDAWGMKGF